MSRTYAHRPLWSRFGDPSVWIEVHDHRFGPCDLLPLAQWAARPCDHWGGLHADRSCSWEIDLNAVPRPCGCALCTGRHERRAERRAERHATKVSLRRGEWVDELEA